MVMPTTHSSGWQNPFPVFQLPGKDTKPDFGLWGRSQFTFAMLGGWVVKNLESF